MQTSSVAVVAALALAGCCPPQPLSAKYTIETRFERGTGVSSAIVLIGDNQTNNVAGGPHFLSTGMADAVVEVAIRPIQLDFYGQSLLTWSLRQQPAGMPIVHMGDADNTSCTGELERFFETMKAAKGEWVMVPGNHDGTYDGNGDLPELPLVDNLLLDRKDWRSACEYAGEPLDRAMFLTRYLRAIAASQVPARSLGNALPAGELGEGEWSAALGEHGMLRRVHWHIRPAEPWRSMVVQEIDFSRSPSAPHGTRGFLMDTNQYAARPTVVPTLTSLNTGLAGQIDDEQRDVVARWVKSDASGQPKYTVLFGHHPYDALTTHSRALLDELRVSTGALTYVSAHTHLGQYYVHPAPEARNDTWLELNVGSIVDTPIEYRTFQIHTDKRGPGRIGFHTDIFRPTEDWFGANPPPDSPICDAAWEAKPPSPQAATTTADDYYLSYKHVPKLAKQAMRLRLMDVMLVSYSRMVTLIPPQIDASGKPPAECAELAAALGAALVATDLPTKQAAVASMLATKCDAKLSDEVSAKRRSYALCQSAWASKYEHAGNRVPDVKDWYVTFPAP